MSIKVGAISVEVPGNKELHSLRSLANGHGNTIYGRGTTWGQAVVHNKPEAPSLLGLTIPGEPRNRITPVDVVHLKMSPSISYSGT